MQFLKKENNHSLKIFITKSGVPHRFFNCTTLVKKQKASITYLCKN